MGEGRLAAGCPSGLNPSVRGLRPVHTNVKPKTLPPAMSPLASAPHGEPLRGGCVVANVIQPLVACVGHCAYRL